MKNERWRMQNGKAKEVIGMVVLNWKLFFHFPFSIFNSPLLTLRVFVPSWQKQLEKNGPMQVHLMLVHWEVQIRVSCLSQK